MLKLTDKNGNQLKVYFEYQDVAGRRSTRAVIARESGSILNQGIARCSADDQFEKAVGRKIALTRALEPFDREFRAQVWLAYWAKVKR